MRKSRKFALAASACLPILAVAIAGTVGVLKVSALGSLSDDVTVLMSDPPSSAVTTFIVFTDDGMPPTSLSVEVEAFVSPITTMGVTPTVDGVDFALNVVGTLDGSATTADDVNAGVLESGIEWSGILDVGTIPSTDYTAITDGMMTQAVVSALASISVAYDTSPGRAAVSAYDEFDSADVDLLILDAAAVGLDINGNCRPDANGLIVYDEGTLVCTGASGNPIYTVWSPLGTTRGGTSEIGLVFSTPIGSLFVDVIAPVLAAIQAADATYNIYDTARLVLSVAPVPTDLLDGPAGVDPLAEFAAQMPGVAAPQNLFALVNILLSDSTAGDPIRQWLALEVLPGGLTITAEFSGASVETVLAAASDVLAYSYDTTNMQVMFPAARGTSTLNALVDYGDQMGWNSVTLALSATRVAPSPGDNTISVALPSASVIAGSNVMPALTSTTVGGDGDGHGSCFIATAAYGTPLADDINVLRSLRDSYMLNNAVGTAFVDMYYRLSPPVADSVAGNAAMKTVVRTLLAPVVIVGSFLLAMPGVSVLMLLTAAGFVAMHVRRRTTRV